MKLGGNLDFQLNKALSFVIESYDGSIDPANPFPANTVQGRLILRTDQQQIYICISDNPIVWQPLIKVAATYVHNQTTVAGTWNIVHNLSTTNVMVQAYDSSGNKFIPDDITIVNGNNITVTVSPNTAGKALVIALDAQIGVFVEQNKLSVDVLKSRQAINNVVYDANNNPTEVDYADGTVATVTYNTDSTIATLVYKNSANVVIESWIFNYDTNGRLISTQRTV